MTPAETAGESASVTSEPGMDPQTGRPWGIDEDGFDHNGPHDPNDWCRETCADCACGLCRGYQCGPFGAGANS